MKFHSMKLTAAIGLLSVFGAHASDTWETISNVSTDALIAGAFVVPAYKKDWEGAKQAAFSIGSAAGTSIVAKHLIHEERPDHSGDDSFPSNHASAAFAAATTLNIRYGWQYGVPAYGLAALTAVGRVQADRHYWKDVVAGAAIGTTAGYLFTHKFSDNLAIAPWFDGHGDTGVMVSMRW